MATETHRKRLIVELDPEHFRALKRQALEQDITLANLVRRALRLPEERQGVKRITKRKGT